MEHKLTVTESIVVDVTPAELWDLTQDYSRRSSWDSGVLEADVLASAPAPRVRIRAQGGMRAVFQYRQFERPVRTSLALEEIESSWIAGGGGSWAYEAQGSATLWTQTNTLVLKPHWWLGLCAPLLRLGLRSSTRRAMRKAKELAEAHARP